jgi:hypothetical protein
MTALRLYCSANQASGGAIRKGLLHEKENHDILSPLSGGCYAGGVPPTCSQ